VSRLATQINVTPHNLHYHLRCLAEVGLIEETAEKQKTGKRRASVYACPIEASVISVLVDPASDLESYRLTKLRSLWMQAYTEAFQQNFDEGKESSSGERFFALQNGSLFRRLKKKA